MSRFQHLAMLLVAICVLVLSTVVSADAAVKTVPTPPAKQLNLTQYEALPLSIRQLIVAHPTELGESPWSWLKCEVCKKVIGAAESFVGKHGCLRFDVYAVSLCEMAGIGPEDPLADICAAALVAGCPIIVHEIEKHITNPDTLCKDIHMC